MLWIRTKIGEEFSEVVKDICSKHRYCFILDFSNNCRKCVDPLSVHKTSVKTSLDEITLEEYEQFCTSYCILPGQKNVFGGKIKLNVDSVENQNQGQKTDEETVVTDDLSFEAACSLVNQSLEIFDCSPLKAIRLDRTVALGKRKIQDVTSKFTDVVSVVLTESQVAENTDVCDNCMKLVYSIKEKKQSDKERKIQLLVLVHDDWSIHRKIEFFNVREYSAKQARNLRKEKGILGIPKSYSGINRRTKLLIAEFCDCDAVSHICPGKKDCVSIKLEDGSKEKVKKRLLLKIPN